MRGNKEFTVDELSYTTSQYSATKGIKLLTRMSKIIGRSVGLFAGDMDAEINAQMLSNAIGAIMDQVDENSVLSLIKDLLEGVKVNSGEGYRPIQFDIDFAGRYGHLFKVLKEVLEFQYSDFFGQLAAAQNMLRRVPESPKKTIKAK